MQGLFRRLSSSSEHKLRSLNETVSFSKNHGMATLRVPELVPSPAQDSERLKQAFDGSSLSLSLSSLFHFLILMYIYMYIYFYIFLIEGFVFFCFLFCLWE